MMRTILSTLILFFTIWFAVSNAAAVSLNIFLWHVSVSAALVIFVTFTVGFAFGVLRVAPSWLRKNSQIGTHQKQLQICLEECKEHTERIRDLEIELTSERAKAHISDESE